jgi:hypothetical protein
MTRKTLPSTSSSLSRGFRPPKSASTAASGITTTEIRRSFSVSLKKRPCFISTSRSDV